MEGHVEFCICQIHIPLHLLYDWIVASSMTRVASICLNKYIFIEPMTSLLLVVTSVLVLFLELGTSRLFPKNTISSLCSKPYEYNNLFQTWAVLVARTGTCLYSSFSLSGICSFTARESQSRVLLFPIPHSQPISPPCSPNLAASSPREGTRSFPSPLFPFNPPTQIENVPKGPTRSHVPVSPRSHRLFYSASIHTHTTHNIHNQTFSIIIL